MTSNLAADAARIRDELEHGRGFILVDTARFQPAPKEELTQLFCMLGSRLGAPVEQNTAGTLLYHVTDSGGDVQYGARFSTTNAESTFHTDASFVDRVPEFVGLLCLNDAKAGGVNQIVSGHSVRERLQSDSPEAWRELNGVFHFDRRGGTRPDEPPTARHPVFEVTPRGLVIRYLRFWIEAGHEKAGEPLTDSQRSALDALDRVANDPSLRAEFRLRPGEILFANNRWLLHNRTSFEDHPEPDRKRHLLRLWLTS